MKKILFSLVVIMLVLIINSLVHSILELWQKQDLIVSAQKELDREREKNQKLKAQYAYAQTPQFIEEEAHNKLFLVKPGEQEVLIAQNLLEKAKAKEIHNQQNWQKWLEFFLNKN